MKFLDSIGHYQLRFQLTEAPPLNKEYSHYQLVLQLKQAYDK